MMHEEGLLFSVSCDVYVFFLSHWCMCCMNSPFVPECMVRCGSSFASHLEWPASLTQPEGHEPGALDNTEEAPPLLRPRACYQPCSPHASACALAPAALHTRQVRQVRSREGSPDVQFCAGPFPFFHKAKMAGRCFALCLLWPWWV